MTFPGNKDFAFTIFDDTDFASVANVKPIYEYLVDLGMLTTKSVWVLPSKDDHFWANRGTGLYNDDYLKFILSLKDKGFEIALHSMRGGDSNRQEIIEGFRIFKDLIGEFPITFANHAKNRENLYWGEDRFGSSLKYLIKTFRRSKLHFEGCTEESEFFWADIAKSHIQFARNFVFNEINTLRADPYTPYHDPSKPFVNYWFSSSNGKDVVRFNDLLSRKNIDRLIQQRGVCILYTHFSFNFLQDGKVNPAIRDRLKYIASQNGYFVPVGELLRYLKSTKKNQEIGSMERFLLEIRWLSERFFHGGF